MISDKLGRLLYRFSIYPNLCGYHYLMVAVSYAREHPEALLALTKQLYPATAHRCRCKMACVERGIRTAISRAWAVNPKLFQDLARHEITQPPTSGDFICMLCYYLDHPDILDDLE